MLAWCTLVMTSYLCILHHFLPWLMWSLSFPIFLTKNSGAKESSDALGTALSGTAIAHALWSHCLARDRSRSLAAASIPQLSPKMGKCGRLAAVNMDSLGMAIRSIRSSRLSFRRSRASLSHKLPAAGPTPSPLHPRAGFT